MPASDWEEAAENGRLEAPGSRLESSSSNTQIKVGAWTHLAHGLYPLHFAFLFLQGRHALADLVLRANLRAARRDRVDTSIMKRVVWQLN